MPDEPYYRRNLALVHHLGFGFHADACAPAILELLDPVRGGVVLELGCGTGLLTRHLVDAGHRVIATDASPAMLAVAAEHVPDAEELRRVVLPGDALPDADAVVSVGHVLNYLPNAEALHAALAAAAKALRPRGVLALDLCSLEYGRRRRHDPPRIEIHDDWAIATRFSTPTPDRFVREITTFVRDGASWRRDDERHENVLVDASRIPAFLREHGLDATVRPNFGDEALPPGLVAVVGSRPGVE